MMVLKEDAILPPFSPQVENFLPEGQNVNLRTTKLDLAKNSPALAAVASRLFKLK